MGLIAQMDAAINQIARRLAILSKEEPKDYYGRPSAYCSAMQERPARYKAQDVPRAREFMLQQYGIPPPPRAER